MPPKQTLKLTEGKATGYFLFIDIVGYSRLTFAGQQSAQEQLQHIVERCPDYSEAHRNHRLVVRPTSDGMMLAFFDRIEQPLRCAIDVDTGLRNLRTGPGRQNAFHVCMGIHSGLTTLTRDSNEVWEVAGTSVMVAQRVMNCGDRDHILVSGEVGDELSCRPEWSVNLRYMGACKVKQDQVRLYNLQGVLANGQVFGSELTPRVVYENSEKQSVRQEADLKKARAEDIGNRVIRYGTFIVVLVIAVVLYTTTGVGRYINGLVVHTDQAKEQKKRTAQSASNTPGSALYRLPRPSPTPLPARGMYYTPPAENRGLPSVVNDSALDGSYKAPGPVPLYPIAPSTDPIQAPNLGSQQNPGTQQNLGTQVQNAVPPAASNPASSTVLPSREARTGYGTNGNKINYNSSKNGIELNGPGN